MTTGTRQDRNYLDGDCQKLASALQKVTRWDVAFIDGAGCHVITELPDGRYLDWAGIHTADELAAVWQAQPEHIGDINDLGWLGCNPDVTDFEAARAVLAQHGLLNESAEYYVRHHIDEIQRQAD